MTLNNYVWENRSISITMMAGNMQRHGRWTRRCGRASIVLLRPHNRTDRRQVRALVSGTGVVQFGYTQKEDWTWHSRG
jgi:hypothetical protein